MPRKKKSVFVVPDGFKLVKVRGKKERIKELDEEIKRFESVEPSNSELLEWAKENHMFYLERPFLEELEEEKRKLEE